MGCRKNVLRALGPCLVVALGLAAFSVSGAQAQTGWLVGGAFITKTETINAAIHPLASTGTKHIVLLGERFGVKFQEICGKVTTDDGLLFANEVGQGLAGLLFTECHTFFHIGEKFEESKICQISEPTKFETKFHPILHSKKTYLLFEPEKAGGNFAEIQFPNEECIFNPFGSVAGTFVVECLNEKLEKNTGETDYCLQSLLHHLIQEAPNQKVLFGDGLTFGGNPASLDGIFDLTQNGISSWAVHI